MNSTSALDSNYFYNQLTELAAQQDRKSRTSSKHASSEETPSITESNSPRSDEEVLSVPDQNCREVIKTDHPFLKYAVKLGYQLELAQDALSRLGAAASTDSLLKAVLYSYAALNPSRRSRNNRRHYGNYNNNNNNRTYHNHHHNNQYMSNGKPFPSYMITRDSYQRFNGHHPEISALKSALSQGPITLPQNMNLKPISPPNSHNNGVYTSQNNDPYDLNVNAAPFQPFAYSLESSPDSLSLSEFC